MSIINVFGYGIVSAADNSSPNPIMHIIGGYSVGEDTTATINLFDSEKQAITGQSTVHVQGKLYKISGSSISVNVKLPSEVASLTVDDGAFAISLKKSDTPTSASLNIGFNNKIKTYGVLLKDAYGNPVKNKQVTVSINGEEKTVNTDDKGEVLISVSVPKNTNYADISYSSQDNSAKSNNILGALSSSNNVDDSSNVVLVASKIKAASKSFKVKTKTKKYSVSLLDKNNKPIKFQKVTLKINGKTFKVTTNKYGKATFKINNLNKKGKFTCLIKFNGNGQYTASNKQVKITVK